MKTEEELSYDKIFGLAGKVIIKTNQLIMHLCRVYCLINKINDKSLVKYVIEKYSTIFGSADFEKLLKDVAIYKKG